MENKHNKKVISRVKYVPNMLIGEIQKSKTEQAWSITKLVSSFLWSGSKFMVKNAPTVLGMAWEVKKEISNEIVTQIAHNKKEQKILEMENAIIALKENK